MLLKAGGVRICCIAKSTKLPLLPGHHLQLQEDYGRISESSFCDIIEIFLDSCKQ